MNKITAENLSDKNEMFKWIETMYKLGARRPGSEPDHKCEEFLLKKMESFGLINVRKEPISITCWEVEDFQLQLINSEGKSKKVKTHYIPYTNFTKEQGIEAELVYIKPEFILTAKKDWAGKIVVTEIGFPKLDTKLLKKLALYVYDPDENIEETKHPATWIRLNWHLYYEAFKRGAVGFIGILKDQPGGSEAYYAPYGFKEKNILDKPIPGLWVGRDYKKLIEEWTKKKGTRARMVLTGKYIPEGITNNVIGEVPGTENKDEIILISCHHDSPFESAVEDASGCAVILAIAKYFAKTKSLHRKLMVNFSAGHFYGSIGTRTFIKKNKGNLLKNLVLEISIEHIAEEAIEDKNGKLIPAGRPELSGIFVPFNRLIVETVKYAVRNSHLKRTVLLSAEGPFGNYPPTDSGDYYSAGIPVINYICNPVYLLNKEDTIHWIAKERLEPVLKCFIEIIQKCDLEPRKKLLQHNYPVYQTLMRLLKYYTHLKITKFGTRPTE